MSLFTKIMRRIIRILDGLVNLIALVMIVSVMLLAGYSLWDANQIYRAAEATAYEAYIPTEEDTRSFEELRALNPEVIGWIRVNDTTINYPVVQAQDNSKYVNTDVEGNYSLSGAIFLNCLNKPDFSDFNSIIYGHHMAKNKMFGDIGLFTDKKYFDEHPYGNLFFEGKDHGIEFFAMLTIDAYDELFFVSEAEEISRQAYLDRVYQQARYIREMDVTAQDRLVLLATCTTSMTNGRNILVGRLSDTVYPEAEAPRNQGTGVDQLIGEMPAWIWILLAAVVLLLVLILILKGKQSKRKKNREGKS
jgi:sortase B